jgi:superfamily II RNA helicase
MIKIMKELNYLGEDNELTKKGIFLLNISRIANIDEILTVELIFKNYFENLKGDNLIATLFYCFSKKKFIKKNYINHDINLLTNKNYSLYNFDEICLDIQKEENKIKDIDDRYITLDEIDEEINTYINIICQWTKYSSFKNILLTNENLLEGKIIKTINKFAKFINHLSSYNNVLSKSFEKKLKNILKKIKRGIPFFDCSYIENNSIYSS